MDNLFNQYDHWLYDGNSVLQPKIRTFLFGLLTLFLLVLNLCNDLLHEACSEYGSLYYQMYTSTMESSLLICCTYVHQAELNQIILYDYVLYRSWYL